LRNAQRQRGIRTSRQNSDRPSADASTFVHATKQRAPNTKHAFVPLKSKLFVKVRLSAGRFKTPPVPLTVLSA
jgi:hypothetical protein